MFNTAFEVFPVILCEQQQLYENILNNNILLVIRPETVLHTEASVQLHVKGRMTYCLMGIRSRICMWYIKVLLDCSNSQQEHGDL